MLIIPPPYGVVKCNIGTCWSSKDKVSGASWVIRDCCGKVLLHSRMSFSNVFSKCEAEIQNWSWAIESMKSLRYTKVSFAADTKIVVEAVLKPTDRPSR